MVDALLDSSVIVDVIRGYAPAISWWSLNQSLRLGISPGAWMETIGSAPNKAKRDQVTKLLINFEMLYLEREDMDWAMERQVQFQLSHGVGILDCLIAAPCVRLNIPLYTRNLKHFAPLLNMLAIQPY